ncbi:MAG: uridine kinase [Fimbriimonadaceae bacterium]
MHLIAIAGLSCSGKTTLAQKLSETLTAPIIALDDYYLALRDFSFEQRTKCNFDAPEMFDHALLLDHLCRLRDGKPIQKPVYDFVTFTRSPETQVILPSSHVILEGMYSLLWPEINTLAEVRVFLDVEPATCLGRRIERDVSQRGRTPEEVAWRFERDVMPMYEKFLVPTKDSATHICKNLDVAQEIDLVLS